jgi:hypothetical protein
MAGKSPWWFVHCHLPPKRPDSVFEIKLRVERRAGELLGEMDGKGSHGGDRKSSRTMRLENFGITKSQSSRWQTEASVPEAVFSKSSYEPSVVPGNCWVRWMRHEGTNMLARTMRISGRKAGSPCAEDQRVFGCEKVAGVSLHFFYRRSLRPILAAGCGISRTANRRE